MENRKSELGGSHRHPFLVLPDDQVHRARKGQAHVYGRGLKCSTDTRGYPTPNNDNPLRIVVDATEGFIPLWQEGSILRWRFQEHSFAHFADPTAVKTAVRNLFGRALLGWGDAAPVRFAERRDGWDFEIKISSSDDCDVNGCTLAMAFFPDAGRHELMVYPKMFQQSAKEQVETLEHEIGHVFGLRHFFAQISEQRWKSEIFGKHRPFSIMNYGAKSRMTARDKSDLKRLYQLVWSGNLTQINGTPIRLVRPFHMA